MKCPYCNSKMLKGAIYGRGDLGIPWLPDDTNQPKMWTKNVVKRSGGLYLADVVYFRPTSVATWVCTSCCRAIIDYSDKK